MNARIAVGFAVVVTAVAATLWATTGAHVYTKFEVVERVEQTIDPDDPLAGTGFYEGTATPQVERRPEFHLGLLPAPQGLLDRHALSVLSLLVIAWLPVMPFLARARIGRRREPLQVVPRARSEP